MWFDARRVLAELEAAKPASEVGAPATLATTATRARGHEPRVAIVAGVASPGPRNLEPLRAERLHPDARALLDFLCREGPQTYGAAASALGWGATKAWQAEARLRAAGMVRNDDLGRAVLKRQGTR